VYPIYCSYILPAVCRCSTVYLGMNSFLLYSLGFFQVYLPIITLNRYKITCGAGGYDKEDKAAMAYDLATLKYWDTNATTNYPVSDCLFFFICNDTEEKLLSISYDEKILKLSLHTDTLHIIRCLISIPLMCELMTTL
jgi:hypothetical protein